MSAVVDSESGYLNEIDCYNMCIHKHSVYVALIQLFSCIYCSILMHTIEVSWTDRQTHKERDRQIDRYQHTKTDESDMDR